MAIWSGFGGGGAATTAATAAAATVVVVGGVVGWQVMRPDTPGPTPEPPAVELAVELAVVAPQPVAESETPVEITAPDPESAGPTPPSFDVVRVDADGNALVAGRAVPRAHIKVLLDGDEISQSPVDAGGSFAAFFAVPPADRPRVVSLLMEIDGKAAIPSDATVILAPSQRVLAEVAPDPSDTAPADSAPTAEVVAALENPVDLAEAPADPTPEAESSSDLSGAMPDQPATPGEPAPKPEIIAAVKPEPSSDVPVDLAEAPVSKADVVVATDAPVETVADTSVDVVPGAEPSPDPAPVDVAEHAEPVTPTPGVAEGVEGEVLPTPTPEPTVVEIIPESGPTTQTESTVVATMEEPKAEPNISTVAVAVAESEPEPVVEPEQPSVAVTEPEPEPVVEPEQPSVAVAEPEPVVEPEQPSVAVAEPEPVVEPEQPSVVVVAEPAPEPAAPSVLLADNSGIRVLQTGGPGPQGVQSVVIDTISYDPAGEVSLGGRGTGTGFVRVYLNNRPIKTTKIGVDGQWHTPLPEVDTGVYTLRVDEVDGDGQVTSRAETPFKREEPEVLAALDTRNDVAQSASVGVITVQPGNTLWGIADEKWGDGFLYVRVFDANKDRIRDPNLIYPGQVFAIPN